MKTIWRREWRAYFLTPVGYVFIGVFLAVSSVLFFLEILAPRSGDLPTFYGSMSYLWMLLSPILTMRLLAEERQKRTDQLLLTASLTLVYVLVVAMYGTVYPAELAVNLLGFVLQGCAFAAMDLFLSGCASTPVIAAVLSFGANFLLWMLDLLENAVGAEWVARILRFLSLYRRNETFLMGQLSFAGILYEVSFAGCFLALTIYLLHRRRIA